MSVFNKPQRGEIFVAKKTLSNIVPLGGEDLTYKKHQLLYIIYIIYFSSLMKNFLLIFIITIIAFGCQRKIQINSGELQKLYEEHIDSILADSSQLNEISKNEVLIKDEKMFINIIEPILFNIYGKERITNQRPYAVYFVKNYCIIKGYSPPTMEGGVFEAIMDARNGKIIRISHGA